MTHGSTPPPNDRHPGRSARERASSRGRHRFWRIVKITSIVVGGLVVMAIGAGVGYAAILLHGLPKITPDTFANNSAASTVYDRNGQVLYRFTRDGDYEPIQSINDVSPYLVNAFVAAEDKTFFHNIGINPLAIARAAVQDVLGHRIESGASTITQQTVKLALFPDQERTIKRKVQEIALALEVNHMLSKQEIMTDYMNWVYMGRMGAPAYGVKTASEILFQKNPKDLNLAEAAFIAAIPNNPTYYNPYRYTNGKYQIDPSHAIQRQRWILGQMLANRMISQAQYDEAIRFNIAKDIHPVMEKTQQYPYLIRDNVEPLVARALVQAGLYKDEEQADAALSTAGFQIYTTIDKSIQDHVDRVLSNDALFKGTDLPVPDYIRGHETMPKDLYQAGVTMIDNQTGGIVAIGGGRPNHYYPTQKGAPYDQIDHSDTPRQTGSSIKPLVDYGPAIELRRITAASPLLDGPGFYNWTGTNGKGPSDDEPGWRGIVTAREALTQSYNLPAIRVLSMITPEVGTSFLAKMGITPQSTTLAPVGGKGLPTLDPSDRDNLATAIGGLKYGLTVQQMTSAFTVFPNQGVWRKPYLIAKITDHSGHVVYQNHPQADVAFSPQTAYVLTDMMLDVVRRGTATPVGRAYPGQYIAGKTGTSENQTDGWFIGFTQQYTLGIWMGYNHNQPIPRWAYNLKFTLWNQMMQPILQHHPATRPFPQPSGIVRVAVCKKSGQLPTALCQADNDVYTEVFIQGTQPTQPCKVHVQAQYTVINGVKYLATTNTPPDEIRTGIFLKPPFPVPAGVVMDDSAEYLPTQPDPRGGAVLTGATGPGNQAPPDAPQNVTAMVVNGRVQLTWNAVAHATGYQVWRATQPNGPFHKASGILTTTQFIDKQPPSGAPVLYYEVAAISKAGVSKPSNVIAVPTGSPGAGNTGMDNGTGADNGTTPGNDTGTGTNITIP